MKAPQTKLPVTSNPEPIAEFAFGGVSPYADKDEYIEKNLVFTIHSLDLEAGRGFEGADRWAASIEPDDGRGSEIMTFACNAKRDEEFSAAHDHIAGHGAIRGVRLKKSGKAYYFETPARTTTT